MFKNLYKSIFIMIKYATVPSILFICLSILSAIFIPLNLYSLECLIESFEYFYDGIGSYTSIILYGSFLIITIIFSSNIQFLNNFIKISIQRRLNRKFNDEIIDKFNKISYECFERSDFKDTLSRMSDSPQDKIINIFIRTIKVVSTFISILSLGLLFKKISILFTIAYFIIIVLLIFLDYKSMNMMNTMFNNQSGKERKLSYYNTLLSNKDSLFELKIFGAIDYIRKNWKFQKKQVLKERINVTVKSQKYFLFSSFCILLWVILITVILVNGIITKKITLAIFVSLLGSAESILTITETLSYDISTLSQNHHLLEHYNKFMKFPEIHENEYVTIDFSNIEIEFKNVSFIYPNTSKKILDNLSFKINSGEHIALVGENGSGKSTIVKLLSRLYTPNEGEILINGINLNNISSFQLRKLVSGVFQDYVKYHLSLRENVGLGNIEEINNDNLIINSLKKSGFIYDYGLETNFGKIENNSIDLSGGEWQKLAIARAYISTANIFILDEPTSALDPISENYIYSSFVKALDSKTCLIISHRLGIAKYADKIFVLKDGKILETGKHNELISKKGFYAKMYSSQQSWYLEDNNDEEK